MKRIIFISGVRGVGKTTILKYLRRFKEFICLEFYDFLKAIAKFNKTSWLTTEQEIGLKIKELAFKNKTVIFALHCAVPHENLFEDIKNNVKRDFSERFDVGLTHEMIRCMNSEEIDFIFIYVKVNSGILRRRLKKDIKQYPKRVSEEYFKNLEKIQKIDYLKFKEIISEFKSQGIKFKYFIISNNSFMGHTLNCLKRIIYERV